MQGFRVEGGCIRGPYSQDPGVEVFKFRINARVNYPRAWYRLLLLVLMRMQTYIMDFLTYILTIRNTGINHSDPSSHPPALAPHKLKFASVWYGW